MSLIWQSGIDPKKHFKKLHCQLYHVHSIVLTLSLSVSRAEVASSNKRIRGFLTSALAMAILCF